jgi:hypothetical protein
MEDRKFRFLSSEEFSNLKQSEKLEYLARAVAALERCNGRWQQLLSENQGDAPRPPE